MSYCVKHGRHFPDDAICGHCAEERMIAVEQATQSVVKKLDALIKQMAETNRLLARPTQEKEGQG